MNENTQAVILAAGAGLRLGLPIPKSMALVGNVSIIHRQLAALHDVGIEDFVIVVGFQQEQLWRHLADEPGHFAFVNNNRFEDTNTIYSLYLAREHITGPFVYANADVVLDRRVLDHVMSSCAPASLAVRTGQCAEEDVKVQIQDNRVVHIGKSLDPAQHQGEFLGIAYFDAKTASQLIDVVTTLVQDQGVLDDYFERAVDQICTQTPVAAVDVTDLPCIEVDFPEDLDTARQDILPRLQT